MSASMRASAVRSRHRSATFSRSSSWIRSRMISTSVASWRSDPSSDSERRPIPSSRPPTISGGPAPPSFVGVSPQDEPATEPTRISSNPGKSSSRAARLSTSLDAPMRGPDWARVGLGVSRSEFGNLSLARAKNREGAPRPWKSTKGRDHFSAARTVTQLLRITQTIMVHITNRVPNQSDRPPSPLPRVHPPRSRAASPGSSSSADKDYPLITIATSLPRCVG